MDDRLQPLYTAILEGEHKTVAALTQQAIDAGIAPAAILTEGMVSAMNEVGRLFEEGEYFVPEMLVAARSMQSGLGVLKPYLAQADVQPLGKIIAGTVKGDLHDIGKNLVCMMLEGAAFEIVDLGSDVSPEKFVEAVQTSGAKIVAMSALLTTTMPNMKATIQALEAAGVRQSVKVMVGGAPVTEAYAREIGADGYAPDASKAVSVAKSLL